VLLPRPPFALLAAHKKRVADRLADLLLAAAAAWPGIRWARFVVRAVAACWRPARPPGLQLSAVCLALAVMLRTALLPVHGWLIQVMEAPTPVSALLHAGVVNLGGFVLIRFAPLLEAAPRPAGCWWRRAWLTAAGRVVMLPHQHQGAAGLVDRGADGFHADGVRPGPVHPGAAAPARPLALQGPCLLAASGGARDPLGGPSVPTTASVMLAPLASVAMVLACTA
jgi:NAD(P)H-quinone oxidoreductase subunit 5